MHSIKLYCIRQYQVSLCVHSCSCAVGSAAVAVLLAASSGCCCCGRWFIAESAEEHQQSEAMHISCVTCSKLTQEVFHKPLYVQDSNGFVCLEHTCCKTDNIIIALLERMRSIRNSPEKGVAPTRRAFSISRSVYVSKSTNTLSLRCARALVSICTNT
jgi:hypothetical protein